MYIPESRSLWRSSFTLNGYKGNGLWRRGLICTTKLFTQHLVYPYILNFEIEKENWFDVLIIVAMKSTVSWNITLCIWICLLLFWRNIMLPSSGLMSKLCMEVKVIKGIRVCNLVEHSAAIGMLRTRMFGSMFFYLGMYLRWAVSSSPLLPFTTRERAVGTHWKGGW
jgi:hypothetical protein